MNNNISKIATILILITFLSNLSNKLFAQVQEISACANEVITLNSLPAPYCDGPPSYSSSPKATWYVNNELVCNNCLTYDFVTSEIRPNLGTSYTATTPIGNGVVIPTSTAAPTNSTSGPQINIGSTDGTSKSDQIASTPTPEEIHPDFMTPETANNGGTKGSYPLLLPEF